MPGVRILHGEKSREKEKPGMETVRNLQEEGESVGVVGGKRSEGEMAESGIFLFLHLFPSASFPASGGADRLQKENN